MGKTGTVMNASIGTSLTQRIGNTPLLRFARVTAELDDVQVLAKAEWGNPGGSVKDRAVSNIVAEALREGSWVRAKLCSTPPAATPELPMPCWVRLMAFRSRSACHPTFPRSGSGFCGRMGRESFTPIRAKAPMEQSGKRGRWLLPTPGSITTPTSIPTPANWRAHYCNGTADEIWRQSEGRVTHFVAMLGTSGTFVGTSRRLKELKPEIRCISLQPDSPFHGIEGAKHMETSIVPKIYDPTLADENLGDRHGSRARDVPAAGGGRRIAGRRFGSGCAGGRAARGRSLPRRAR